MRGVVERRGGNVGVVAAAYGISPKNIRLAISAGRIDAHAVGRRTVVLYSDVESWIKTLPPPRPWRSDPPFPPRQENPSCPSE
jgi:hypothetical protein